MNENISLKDSFYFSPYLSFKHQNYFEIYERTIAKYVGKNVTLLEIGVLNGGSLFMWRKYLGPKARIVGVDLNPAAEKWRKDGFEIVIGDQSSKDFWAELKAQLGEVDILVDDGGHTNLQQTATLFFGSQVVANGGTIIIEDTHCSYEREFGNPSTTSFLETVKSIIDDQYEASPRFPTIHENIISFEFYKSVLVAKIDKISSRKNEIVSNGGLNQNSADFRYKKESDSLLRLGRIEKLLQLEMESIGLNRRYFSFFNRIVKVKMVKKVIYLALAPIRTFVYLAILIARSQKETEIKKFLKSDFELH